MKNRERWMMKFWLAFILCCISLVLVPMQSESAVYKDVEGSYAASAIEFLAAKGIMQGVTAERFAPEQAITRGDFITVLAKTMGIMPVYPHEATFLDVKKEDSAFGYVEAFGQLGLIKGDNQGFFHSNDPISRQDAAVILSQLGQSNDTGSPVTYKDAGEIAAYAQEAVAQVTQKGWLQGSEGAFKPLDLLTRAQSAVIAQQVYRWRTSQANILSPVEAQVTLEAGETLPGFSASSPLDYTVVYGTDLPSIGKVVGDTFYATNPGNAMVTVNQGNQWRQMNLLVTENQRGSVSSQAMQQGNALSYTYRVEPVALDPYFTQTEYKQYAGPVDGLLSTGPGWTGFLRQQGRNIIADLGQMKPIGGISLEFQQNLGSGIKIPEYLTCEVSVDGKAWYHLGQVMHSVSPDDQEVQTRTLGFTFPTITVQYVKISFPVDVYAFARHLVIHSASSSLTKPVILSPGGMEMETVDQQLSVPGLQDLVLMFSGLINQEDGIATWSADDLVPYVGYVDQNGTILDQMFDSMLFLPFPGSTDTKDAWYAYLDNLFTPNQQLDALNDAVARVNQALGKDEKYKVILTLPYPDTKINDFGPWGLEGDSVSFVPGEVGTEKSYDNRFRAVQFYYQNLLEQWQKASYEHLELVGMYWYKENLDKTIPMEQELVHRVAQMVKSDDYMFLWIPYYGAQGYENWRSYGFSHAILQPNYYAVDNPPESRMDAVAGLVKDFNMGVEVELDDRVTYHRYYYDLFYKQLDKGHALDFDGNITNAYYAGSRTVKNIRLSTVPEVREIYDDLYQWIKGTYMPLKTD